MTRHDDRVTQDEIDAFLIGQLDADRRFAVADHLSRDTESATRAMADLRIQEGVRMALGRADTQPPQGLADAAARLSRRLAPRPRWTPVTVAAVALIAVGWGGQQEIGRAHV